MVALTTSPIKLVIGLWAFIMACSTITRGLFSSYKDYSDVHGLWKRAYSWGLENCNNHLNISEIDVDNFQDGCYYFSGDLKLEGNVTVPPLPETTQCNSVVAYSYIQTYGTYLARQCNFNGQHAECKGYNPACTVDTSNGLGYEIRNGWIPNNDQFVERWSTLIYEYEFEDWLSQSEEWRAAAVMGEVATFAVNGEYCTKLGDGETSICKDDFKMPGYSHLNNSRTTGFFEYYMAMEGYEESIMYINDAENMPIYDVGKDSGTAIHLNLIAYEKAQNAKEVQQREMTIAYDKEQNNGQQTRPWRHMSPQNIPADPDNPLHRHEKIAVVNRKHEWYGNNLFWIMQELHGLQLEEVAQDSADAKFYSPTGFEHGKIIDAPMALGDSFYSDADLEEKRLNGTVPRGSPVFLWTDEPISFHPYAYSQTVADKIRANGGELTDAEFKALPEYGDIDHFPLVTNESYWLGGDNCWSENGHGSEQMYPYGTVKVTPTCRIEPPKKTIDYLGMVSKTTNKNTGEPMLIWNPIIFTDDDNDLSKLDSHINPIPETVKAWESLGARNYPDMEFYYWIGDIMADAGAFYGLPWYHNSLERKHQPIFYYLTWFWFQDPHLYLMRAHSTDNTIYDLMKAKAADNDVAYKAIIGSYVGGMGTIYFFIAYLMLRAKKEDDRSSDE